MSDGSSGRTPATGSRHRHVRAGLVDEDPTTSRNIRGPSQGSLEPWSTTSRGREGTRCGRQILPPRPDFSRPAAESFGIHPPIFSQSHHCPTVLCKSGENNLDIMLLPVRVPRRLRHRGLCVPAQHGRDGKVLRGLPQHGFAGRIGLARHLRPCGLYVLAQHGRDVEVLRGLPQYGFAERVPDGAS